ncbi:AcvB/VirJ family lysyl-phosphatidylglycerol hydrolase [Paraherbaspirillum soli]|uniref:AcvB/VirJ family lysyl-phosphatidylglycerol hydrolase n=1 Tax=Paraherbaspirillum soli TaxID=631222 RepID=A0ABW0M6C4_9BURK
MKRKLIGLMALAAGFISNGGMAQALHHSLSHGRFKNVEIYKPQGEVNGVVLMLSGDAGWNQGAGRQAQALAEQGALVAGISTPQLFENLNADGGDCVFPDGDLENLSRFVQAYEKLPGYYPPLLVGESSGATLAYAMLAQAPANTFAGALSLGFCPTLTLRKPLCTGENLHFKARAKGAGADLLPVSKLPAAWRVLLDPSSRSPAQCDAKTTQTFVATVGGAELQLVPRTDKSWLPQLKAAYASLNGRRPATAMAPPAAVSDLPLIEVAAAAPLANANDADSMAILLSGDGGWAGIDRDVAAALSKRGVPVVGLDSLRYFWSERSPASTAADVDRLMHFYMAHWRKSKVLLIGYSQGADVLPFVVNRLAPANRTHLALVAMMGLGKQADFQFHLTNWVSSSNDGLPIPPEVAKLPAGLGMCIYGAEESDSACPELDAGHVKLVKLTGGHHFDGNYDHLAGIVLDAARK